MGPRVVTALFGLVLLGYAMLAVYAGRLPGRSGMTSLTASRYPVLFWSFVVLFALGGALCMLYAIGKTLNMFQGLTGALDKLASITGSRDA